MTEEKPAQNQPFTEWLAAQRQGVLNDELTAAFGELIERVTLLGRKGSLTLKVEVKPQATGVVIVTDDIAAKPPREDRPGAVWFVDGDSNLTRTNKAQPELPLDREEPAE